jgi:hypothetical protein
MIWSILSRRWRERVKAQNKVNKKTTGDTVTMALLSPQTMGKAVQKIEKVMPKSPRNTSCHMYGIQFCEAIQSTDWLCMMLFSIRDQDILIKLYPISIIIISILMHSSIYKAVFTTILVKQELLC